DAHPLLHGPALAGVEARGHPGLDQLVDPLRGQLHHELAPADHGEDLAADPKPGVRTKPVPSVTPSPGHGGPGSVARTGHQGIDWDSVELRSAKSIALGDVGVLASVVNRQGNGGGEHKTS